MAGKSSFAQPIRHGKDTGVAVTSTLANALVSQRVGVSAGVSASTQIARLTDNTEGGTITHDIYGFEIDVLTAQTEVSGSDVALQIGTSGDSTYFGRIKVSGVGRYLVTTAHASSGGLDKWFDVAAGTSIFAVVSAAGSGGDPDLTGHITTIYTPR